MATGIPANNDAACEPYIWSLSSGACRASLQQACASRLFRLHYACVTAEGIRWSGRSIRSARLLEGGTRLCPACGNNSGVKWNFLKKINLNSVLWRKLDHICVLFVQHPSEKGLSQAFRSGSFVACAEVLGNCDLATEGGIPRSSR